MTAKRFAFVYIFCAAAYKLGTLSGSRGLVSSRAATGPFVIAGRHWPARWAAPRGVRKRTSGWWRAHPVCRPVLLYRLGHWCRLRAATARRGGCCYCRRFAPQYWAAPSGAGALRRPAAASGGGVRRRHPAVAAASGGGGMLDAVCTPCRDISHGAGERIHCRPVPGELSPARDPHAPAAWPGLAAPSVSTPRAAARAGLLTPVPPRAGAHALADATPSKPRRRALTQVRAPPLWAAALGLAGCLYGAGGRWPCGRASVSFLASLRCE